MQARISLPYSFLHTSGHRITLLGDSCHIHLPTNAHGALQATDGGKGNIPFASDISFRETLKEKLIRNLDKRVREALLST